MSKSGDGRAAMRPGYDGLTAPRARNARCLALWRVSSPLRAFRLRTKAGPAPAPLRRKLAAKRHQSAGSSATPRICN